jgi:hypothetical protein
MELNNTQHGIFKSPCHRPFFIAVHVGVGQHSAQKEKAYKTGMILVHAVSGVFSHCALIISHRLIGAAVMRQACRMGAEELQAAGDPLQAVVAAVSSLEVGMINPESFKLYKLEACPAWSCKGHLPAHRMLR